MSIPLKQLYTEFLSRSRVFASVDELVRYKKKWPLRSFVKQSIDMEKTVRKRSGYYVGLDVSSKSTGLCILKSNRSVVLLVSSLVDVLCCKAIRPTAQCKGSSILSSSYIFSHFLSEVRKHDPAFQSNPSRWHVTIEKYLQMFNATSFRTQGLFYLAEINGVMQYKCWESFQAPPLLLHPSTARALVGLKSAGSREETKKVVFEYVKKEVGEAFSWPLKRNKNGYADECYDMADSYVIARAAVIEDCVDAIWEDWRMEEAIHKSLCLSPVFSDFCKVNLAYHLRKHMSEMIGTLDDLSPELVETYSKKLRSLIEEVVSQYYLEM
ncbi:hypothetical protein BLSTO_05318 [Blastocystis sp. subtype 1]